jgi:hypothetical protein
LAIPSFDTVKDFIVTMGWTKGVFALFFFIAHGALFKAYEGRLRDQKREIDRLTKEKDEYIHRLLSLMDSKFGIQLPESPPTSQPVSRHPTKHKKRQDASTPAERRAKDEA